MFLFQWCNTRYSCEVAWLHGSTVMSDSDSHVGSKKRLFHGEDSHSVQMSEEWRVRRYDSHRLFVSRGSIKHTQGKWTKTEYPGSNAYQPCSRELHHGCVEGSTANKTGYRCLEWQGYVISPSMTGCGGMRSVSIYWNDDV